MPVLNHHARLYDPNIPCVYFYLSASALRDAQSKLDLLCPGLWSAKTVKDESGAGHAPAGDAKRYGFWIDPQVELGLVADCLTSAGAIADDD